MISVICCCNQACCDSARKARRVCPMISPDDGRVSYLTDAPVETVALRRSGELGGRTETAAGETRLDGMLFSPAGSKLDVRRLLDFSARWRAHSASTGR